MHSLFRPNKKHPPNSNRNDNDQDDEDSDMDDSPPKRKPRRGSRAKESDSSSDDAEQSSLFDIKKKKDKKARRDTTLAITSPMALGLKWLVNDNPTTSALVEQAVLLRAIKPNTTTIEMVYKNPNLLDWDHPLIISVNKKMFEKQSRHYHQRRKFNKSARIAQGGMAVIGMLMDDQLLVTPKALYTVMNAYWTKFPSSARIYDGYHHNRTSFTTNPANRSRNIARIQGLCIGYNFHWDGCQNTDCPYAHNCAFHQNEQLQHCSMRCTDNPNKWKPRRQKNNKGGKGRGRGNRNYYNRGHYNQGPNQWQQPPNFQPHQHHQHHNNPNQMWGFNPNQFQGGNKDRFFHQQRK